jgi:hypothetical protein
MGLKQEKVEAKIGSEIKTIQEKMEANREKMNSSQKNGSRNSV